MSDEEKFADIVHEELFRRLKSMVNSKRSRLTIRVMSTEIKQPWSSLEVTGRASLIGFESHISFDFTLRNSEARDFLRASKLEGPHDHS